MRFENEVEIDAVIVLSCDKTWEFQSNPKPRTTPQTHLSQTRLKNYYFAENGNYSIKDSSNALKYFQNVRYLAPNSTANLENVTLIASPIRCDGAYYPSFYDSNSPLIMMELSKEVLEKKENQTLYKYQIHVVAKTDTLNFGSLEELSVYLFDYGDVTSCETYYMGNPAKLQSVRLLNERFEYAIKNS